MTSPHTSARCRIDARRPELSGIEGAGGPSGYRADPTVFACSAVDWLAPLPMGMNWWGRRSRFRVIAPADVAGGLSDVAGSDESATGTGKKRGAIPALREPIVERLGLTN
jgi:hypothetical protein